MGSDSNWDGWDYPFRLRKELNRRGNGWPIINSIVFEKFVRHFRRIADPLPDPIVHVIFTSKIWICRPARDHAYFRGNHDRSVPVDGHRVCHCLQ